MRRSCLVFLALVALLSVSVPAAHASASVETWAKRWFENTCKHSDTRERVYGWIYERQGEAPTEAELRIAGRVEAWSGGLSLVNANTRSKCGGTFRFRQRMSRRAARRELLEAARRYERSVPATTDADMKVIRAEGASRLRKMRDQLLK